MRLHAFLVTGLLLAFPAVSSSPAPAAEFEPGITLINTAQVKAKWMLVMECTSSTPCPT